MSICVNKGNTINKQATLFSMAGTKKKKNLYKQNLSETALIGIMSPCYSFDIAKVFNKLYKLDFQSKGTLSIEIPATKKGEEDSPAEVPHFYYQNDSGRLKYQLVTLPKSTSTNTPFATSPWPFNHLLLISGQSAFDVMGTIYDELVKNDVAYIDECDREGAMREELRIRFMTQGIAEAHYYNFSQEGYPDTSQFSLNPAEKSYKSRMELMDKLRELAQNVLCSSYAKLNPIDSNDPWICYDDEPDFGDEDTLCLFTLTHKK